MTDRTPATERLQQLAQERTRRLHNEAVAREEQEWREADRRAQVRRERFRVVRP